MRTLLVVVVLFASPAKALATPNFPPLLADYVPMPFEPECALCHNGDATTVGSITTPFGASLRMRGAVADDEDAMKLAIDALRAEGTDSDRDGTGDIAELETGGDPNTAEGDLAPALGYGCGAQIAHGNASAATLLALVLAALIARRARRTN